ncbi:MAG: phosphotransferase [Defluviitaleaceae bacterium]|nr:phosphotransferase [Defluviitaleaceae bacterium]
MLLRISPKSHKQHLKIMFDMMGAVCGLGMPTPVPLELGECDEGVYTLQSFADGEDLQDVIQLLPEAERFALGQRAGENLRKIHTIPAPEDAEDWAARFNRKLDRNIKMYNDCDIRFDGDVYILEYIERARLLLAGRPQCFHHGDYHVGNIILAGGEPVIIDFDRHDFGDPWKEFDRIAWSAEVSPHFATGQVKGYFGGDVPAEFFELLALYLASNVLSSIPWAVSFGQSEVDTMLKQAKNILDWYDNMKNPVPKWYFAG